MPEAAAIITLRSADKGPTQSTDLVMRTGAVVRVRERATTDSSVVTILEADIPLRVVSRVDVGGYVWFEVANQARTPIGFIRGDLLRPDTSADPFGAVSAVAGAGSGPGGCPHCPEMIEIVPGTFSLGASAANNVPKSEQPARVVTLPAPFKMSRTEITVGQFAAFADSERGQESDWRGCRVFDGSFRFEEAASFRVPAGQAEEDWPAVCIAFNEAEAYAAWLSETTGRRFRLPTEAEWEYAARGDKRQIFVVNVLQPCSAANFADSDHNRRHRLGGSSSLCSDGFADLAPVGRFDAGLFQLSDMIGNASEWVLDCWNDSHLGISPTGAPRLDGNCTRRVVRGASFASSRIELRVTYRSGLARDQRFSTVGFRLVEEIIDAAD